MFQNREAKSHDVVRSYIHAFKQSMSYIFYAGIDLSRSSWTSFLSRENIKCSKRTNDLSTVFSSNIFVLVCIETATIVFDKSIHSVHVTYNQNFAIFIWSITLIRLNWFVENNVYRIYADTTYQVKTVARGHSFIFHIS